MQTHLFGEETASKSCLCSQNITPLIPAVLFLKEGLWSPLKEKKKEKESQALSNLTVEQIYQLHTVFSY